MKSILFGMLVLLCVKTCQAQTLFFENDGFEQWDSTQGYLNPQNWYTLNVLNPFGLPITTERTTDAHNGNFAVKLESKDHSNGTLAGVLTTGPIIDAFGNPNLNTIKVPYTFRPTGFSFYYHADPESGDTCIVALILTKRNLALQRIDTVGGAVLLIGDSTASYQKAELNIAYDLPFAPDSMFIIASSSMDGYKPTAGSKLFIDDIKVVGGSTGIEPSFNDDLSVKLWPSPGKDLLQLKSTQNIGSINILDAQGRLVYSNDFAPSSLLINTSTWPLGLYHVLVQNQSTQQQKNWIKF